MEKLSRSIFVNLSPFITADPNGGHFFSVHNKFKEKFSETYNYLAVSSVGGFNNSVDLSILPTEFKSRQVVVDGAIITNVALSIDKFVKSHEIKSSSVIYHIYEGNVNLFLLALELIKLDSSINLIFNFLWFEDEEGQINDLILGNPEILDHVKLSIDLGVLHINCESIKNSKTLSKLINRKITKYPTFSVYDSPLKETNKNIILLIPSSQSEIHLLYKSLNKIIKFLSSYKVICLGHWEKASSKLDYSLLKNLGVRINLDYVPDEEYISMLSRAKIMILPYQTFNWYKSGSSGRLEDALMHKSFVIVPKNTSLYEDNKKVGYVIGYIRNSYVSLILSIAYVLNIKKYTIRFKSRKSFDSSINKLLDYVLDIHN